MRRHCREVMSGVVSPLSLSTSINAICKAIQVANWPSADWTE